MSSPFAGKVAIVTGAANGIGRAVAQSLARQGAKVTLLDIEGDAVRLVASELESEGASAVAVEADVRDSAAVARTVTECFERNGRIDYLFNIAGIGVMAMARDHTLQDWNDVVQTNLFGVIHAVQVCFPLMVRQRSGHIVNMGSMGGVMPLPGNISYVTSKAGVIALSETLRNEGRAHGVRVSVVCPAAVKTEMFQRAKFVSLDREAIMKVLPPGGITAEQCAASILRGVEKNRAMILPHVAKVLWLCHRLLPTFTTWMIRSLTRKFEALRSAPT
jgi:NAD(P)-dependent dehydrogenase (short-subunit alcohol dehydrogenase family)